MVVEIRAHPAGGVDQSLKAASHSRKFTGLHGDFAHEMIVLNAAGDDQSIRTRIQRHVKLARLRVPLIHATVCAVLRAEIRVAVPLRPLNCTLQGWSCRWYR